MAARNMEREAGKPRNAPQKTGQKAGQNAGKPFERAWREARQIADLMPAIGRTAFRRFGFVQSSVVTRWPEIVGQHHARHCAPDRSASRPAKRPMAFSSWSSRPRTRR
jgi:hypothetical protein